MSATGRSDVRDPDDFYATPAWCTDAILPHLTTLPVANGPPFRMLLEPACGTGAIVDRLFAHGVPKSRIMAHEIDVGRALTFAEKHDASVNVWDFLTWAKHTCWNEDFFDCVITNPPFRHAMEFVLAALLLVKARRGEVAMLLRMNWLASQERAAFHREHPSDVYILPRRPSFAASVRCKDKDCGWSVLLPIDADRPKACATCAGKVTVSTSDSTEYAWFVWGPGRGNRWFLLDGGGQ